MLFANLINNIHISPRFIASEGVSAFLLVLLQLEALLRFIGQNLGSTNSSGKSCCVFTVCCSILLMVLTITVLSVTQISRQNLQLEHC